MKELNNSEIISISGGIIIAPTIVFAKFISGFISGIMDKYIYYNTFLCESALLSR